MESGEMSKLERVEGVVKLYEAGLKMSLHRNSTMKSI